MRVQKPEKAADFLPNPETLEAYDYVIEGSAKVILEMIEKEQRHRHSIEERALAIQSSGLFFGQVLAAIVALSVVVGTVLLGLNGEVTIAVFLAVVGLSCMTIAYVKGRQVVAQGTRRLDGGASRRPARQEVATEGGDAGSNGQGRQQHYRRQPRGGRR